MDSYPRTCPYCNSSFRAATDRGICPSCNQFSRIDRQGNFVVLLDAEPIDELPNDDLFRNTPLATLFEFMDSGGGPITTTTRYNERPSVTDVHKQLGLRFRWLKELLVEYGIEIVYNEIEQPGCHADWIGTDFANALRLLTIHWYAGDQRYDVLCELSDSGGSIHAIPPDAKYHLSKN